MASYNLFGQPFAPPIFLDSKVNVLKKLPSLFLQPLATSPVVSTYRMRGILISNSQYVQWDESGTPGTTNAPGPVTDVIILKTQGC